MPGSSTSISSSSSSASGDASGGSGSGSRSFAFGVNPNNQNAANSIVGVVSNPFVIVGAIAITWLILRRKKG